MLAFKKYTLPFQREGDSLAFNVRPLDTIIYTKRNFTDLASKAIDEAILAANTTSRPTRALVSSELLLRYLAVRRLRVTDISTSDGAAFYRLGSALGYYLLDGDEIVYFGLFDRETPREIAFRLKLLLQNLHLTRARLATDPNITVDQVASARRGA
jgi:hypothetical protein